MAWLNFVVWNNERQNIIEIFEVFTIRKTIFGAVTSDGYQKEMRWNWS